MFQLTRCQRQCFAFTLLAPAVASIFAQTAPVRTGEQQSEQTSINKLEPVVVQGTRTRASTPPALNDARRQIEKNPGGASVVDAETYREGRTSTLQDALQMAPGVFVASRFGAEEARLSIRGSGLQRTFHLRGIKLLQDGVPLNLADGGGDFQAVEPLANRYIEVYRGSNALQFGATTLGGAVNFVSPTGKTAAALEARAELGSYGYGRVQAQVAGDSDSLDGVLSLSHFQQDGFRDHAKQSTQRVFGNSAFRVGSDLESRFFVAGVKTDSELPGNLTRNELDNNPRAADPNNIRNDYKRDFDLVRISNRTVFEPNNTQRLEVGTFYSYKSLHHPIFQVIDQRSNDVGIEPRWRLNTQWFNVPAQLIVGASFVRGTVDDDRFQNIGGQSGARTNELRTTASNTDLYAEGRVGVTSALSVIAGGQYTAAERDVQDRFFADGADNSVDRTYQRVSPKLGVLYAVSNEVQLFANYSHSFEPPSFGELAGGPNVTPVDAQRARSFEIGSRGRLGAAWQWDVALYRAAVRKELLSLTNAAGTPLGTVNADNTVHQGIEAGIEARCTVGLPWQLRASYLLNDFRFDNDPVFGNRRLAGVPLHVFTAQLQARWDEFYAGPTLTVASRSFIDHANTLAAPGYAVLGLRVGQRVNKGLSWFVEGRNLANRAYAATTSVTANARGIDGRYYLPGEGRAAYAGIEYKL